MRPPDEEGRPEGRPTQEATDATSIRQDRTRRNASGAASWERRAAVARQRAEGTIRSVADRLAVDVHRRDNPTGHSLAGSLRRELVAATMFRTLTTCSHVVLPQVVHALLAKPTKLLCGDCIRVAAERHSRKHPNTCDVCGRETDTFRELMLQLGVVLLAGHACDDCYRREVGT